MRKPIIALIFIILGFHFAPKIAIRFNCSEWPVLFMWLILVYAFVFIGVGDRVKKKKQKKAGTHLKKSNFLAGEKEHSYRGKYYKNECLEFYTDFDELYSKEKQN